jgi:hypothetical protein
MEIVLKLDGRKLDYKIDKTWGIGIDSLIEKISQKNDKIKTIRLSGSTDSYTLMRQVYLFINMCRALVNCAVIIDGRGIAKQILIPDYAAAGYKFNGDRI